MEFKKFCDANGYSPATGKHIDHLEFKAAKKAWFKQQEKIKTLEDKIKAYKDSLKAL